MDFTALVEGGIVVNLMLDKKCKYFYIFFLLLLIQLCLSRDRVA